MDFRFTKRKLQRFSNCFSALVWLKKVCEVFYFLQNPKFKTLSSLLLLKVTCISKITKQILFQIYLLEFKF